MQEIIERLLGELEQLQQHYKRAVDLAALEGFAKGVDHAKKKNTLQALANSFDEWAESTGKPLVDILHATKAEAAAADLFFHNANAIVEALREMACVVHLVDDAQVEEICAKHRIKSEGPKAKEVKTMSRNNGTRSSL